MNLKQFKYVLVLSEEGTFGRAAEVLGISQPSLSQYIKKIEGQLGVTLFNRTAGEVRLTDAGQVYIEAGRKILDIEHKMYGDFADLEVYNSGTLVIGTSPYRSAGMLPSAVKKFREKYPGMCVVVKEMTSQELANAAERGSFDLCLTVLPVDERIFSYEKIATEELILAVPSTFSSLQAKEMKDRRYPAVDARQIDGMPFVTITEGQWMQRALDNMALDFNLTIKRVATVKSLEAQISMVRAGVGAALLPSGIERLASPGEVVYYSFAEALPRREVVLMHRCDAHVNGAMETFINIMKETYSK